MATRMNISMGAAAAVLLAAAVAVQARPSPSAQLPTVFTNLQVLPRDTTQPQLMSVMKTASISLGVRCWFCHEGTGDDFSTFNFAADTKEQKATARAMLRMTNLINASLKDIGPNKGDAGKITCQTCHRGNKTPAK